MKKRIGLGVLNWDGEERRSNRYGSVHLGADIYEGEIVCKVELDTDLLEELSEKRVRLTAVVTEARKSGHIGDLFLKIEPSQPEVGEEVDLGVGVLDVGKGWDDAPTVILQPGDGRKDLWIDPRKLYRLHDQTVELWAEVTTDDFTPGVELAMEEPDGALSTGDSNGSLQLKGVSERVSLKVCPEPVRLGPGLFMFDGTPKLGKRFRVMPGDKDN